MNKEQHVGEILYAQENNQPIEYQCADHEWIIPKRLSALSHILEYPERYRIKKEPKFLYVNMLQETTGPVFTSSFQTKEDAENYKYILDTKVLVRAYPMEVPL